jgi:hypothetical protein
MNEYNGNFHDVVAVYAFLWRVMALFNVVCDSRARKWWSRLMPDDYVDLSTLRILT